MSSGCGFSSYVGSLFVICSLIKSLIYCCCAAVSLCFALDLEDCELDPALVVFEAFDDPALPWLLFLVLVSDSLLELFALAIVD